MTPTDNLEKRIERIRVTASDSLDERILADALARLGNRDSATLSSTTLNAVELSVWRTFVRNKWTQFAAVTAIAVALGAVILHGRIATVAYALEETLEANSGLRYAHVRIEPAGQGLSEAWAQFGASGELLRLRMAFPNTMDGEKEVLWQEGKAEVWFKTKGHVLVVGETEVLERMPALMEAFDPRRITEQLHEAQSSGKLTIETQAPPMAGDPITLVVSFEDFPSKREVYHIDPQTKLVQQLERFRLEGDQYQFVSRFEYLDYNRGIPPEAFVLAVPANTTRIDWTTQQVGLSKGDLADSEIAVKVAREFFEALIAKDYDRAGIACSGLPGSKLKERFGEMELLQILAVGDPTPHPDPETRFLQVSCEVQFRLDGEIHVKTYVLSIRAIYNQPDRWGIDGGI